LTEGGGIRFSRRAALVGSLALGLAGTVRAAAIPRSLVLKTSDGRAIAVTEWRPTGPVLGTILFSHGAASSPAKYDLLIQPWVAAGWHVLAPLHVDSTDHPDTAKFAGLASWKARIEDMRALSAHLGTKQYVAAGHSYGGLTALTLGGAAAVVPEGVTGPLNDARCMVVVAFSPPPPIPVLITAEGYARLSVPALVETGTADVPVTMPGASPEMWKLHLVPFEAPPAGGNRYGLVLEGVDHYFGGAICSPERPGPRQTERLADATRVSALFLKAHGAGDAAAHEQLDLLVTQALPVRLMRR
jgi:pimeloyl-ACP methyl ester carboxylesterase